MTSEEEILIRLGIDTTSMRAGTNAALDLQKKASLEYVGFWESAMAKKEAAEKAQSIKSIERERARAAAVLRINAEMLEAEAAQQKAANIAIAAGSGGFGSARRVEGEVVNDAAAFAAGAIGAKAVSTATKEVAHEAHGFAGIMRESAVLVREFFRGNWSRMVGSVSILVGYLGALAAAVAIPLAAILAVPGYRAWQARKAADQSGKDLDERSRSAGEHLRTEIQQLQHAGALSEKQASDLNRRLESGDVQGVFAAVNPLLKGGTAAEQEKRANIAREVARIRTRANEEELDAYRKSLPLLTHRSSLEIERHELLIKMAKLQKDSVEYAQAQYDVAKLNKEIQSDTNAIAKEKIELQKQYDDEVKSRRRIQGDIAGIDVNDAIPTIEQLAAGGGWLTREKRAYGETAFGGGPFAQIARDAIHAKNQEQWDIAHGNASWTYNPETHRMELTGGQAFEDRSHRIASENQLWQVGMETPAMKQDKMNQDIMDINKKIGDLLTAAQKDGIKIQTTS